MSKNEENFRQHTLVFLHAMWDDQQGLPSEVRTIVGKVIVGDYSSQIAMMELAEYLKKSPIEYNDIPKGF